MKVKHARYQNGSIRRVPRAKGSADVGSRAGLLQRVGESVVACYESPLESVGPGLRTEVR